VPLSTRTYSRIQQVTFPFLRPSEDPMSERQQQPSRSDPGRGRRHLRSPRRSRRIHDLTVPVGPVAVTAEPTILGFPAEFDPTADGGAELPVAEVAPPRAPVPSGATAVPVVVLRTEWVGGLALVLAGVTASVSLALPWFRGAQASGLTLVEEGLGVLKSGLGPFGRSGLWQPVVVVLAGGALLVLGLLLFRPARTHRVVGALALLATLAAVAGVIVPVADANWSTASFGPGMWLAVAVAVLGLVGAVKAMETAPHLRASAG
jgi:hypothetical protein